MIHGRLERRVDLSKLTVEDFVLSSPLKDGSNLFKRDGYVNLAQFVPEDKFHECYELIVQTPNSSYVAGAGYLHRSIVGLALGVLWSVYSGQRVYVNASPIWDALLSDQRHRESIATGPVDLIFVKVSPWDYERDAQRERVLDN